MASSLMKSYNRTLIAIVLGNMFVNICLSITGNKIFASLNMPQWLTTLLSILVVIVLLLVIGEVTPKSIALMYAEKIAVRVSGPVTLLRKILNPLIIMLEKTFAVILDILGRKKSMPLQPEEYSTYLDMAYAIGAFSESETELMNNIFSLRKKNVAKILRDRVNIQCINKNSQIAEIAKIIQESRQAYYPVIDKDIDDSVEFLSARDFYLIPADAREKKLTSAMFSAVFIPENTSLTKALRELKKQKVPTAIAVDEYGGVSGIIYAKDIYRELLGVSDREFEKEKWHIKKTAPGCWILSGHITIDELRSITSIKLPETEANTLNGLFHEINENIPEKGSKIDLDNICIEVLKVEHNTIIEAILSIKDGGK